MTLDQVAAAEKALFDIAQNRVSLWLANGSHLVCVVLLPKQWLTNPTAYSHISSTVTSTLGEL